MAGARAEAGDGVSTTWAGARAWAEARAGAQVDTLAWVRAAAGVWACDRLRLGLGWSRG